MAQEQDVCMDLICRAEVMDISVFQEAFSETALRRVLNWLPIEWVSTTPFLISPRLVKKQENNHLQLSSQCANSLTTTRFVSLAPSIISGLIDSLCCHCGVANGGEWEVMGRGVVEVRCVELHSPCSHHLHSHSITQTPGRCDKLHLFLFLSVLRQHWGPNSQVHIVPVPTWKPNQIASRGQTDRFVLELVFA